MSSKTVSPTTQDAETRAAPPVLIIGAGLAGLYTALKLAPIPSLVISAKDLGRGASSLWAQGGIAAAIGEGDTPEHHTRDTIKAGAGLVDEKIASLVTRNAEDRIHDLLNYGVPFDKDLKGKLALAREAAHRTNRIVHVEGDQAGSAIMAALIEKVKNTPSIHVLEQVEVHRLEAENNSITAAWLWPSRSFGFGEGCRFATNQVVLATGGIGHLYGITTNPPMARGEGLAMAARIGAPVMDAEFIQFHPTAMDIGKDPAPLATEALRGEGATLINEDGKRFMPAYHQDAELAPRDIVARAVYREKQQGRGAFLDCRGPITDRLEEHYRAVLSHCRDAGLDPKITPIPIAPAAHFHMGGIKTNADGKTSLAGLWACGEVAATGLHGANRLASNSLLEALVFGERIAVDISKTRQSDNSGPDPARNIITTEIINQHNQTTPEDLTPAIAKLRHLMFANVGLERNQGDLTVALEEINKLMPTLKKSELTYNMGITAKFITKAALNRTNSIGSHYRTDEKKSEKPPQSSLLTINDMKLAHFQEASTS